MDTLPDPSPFPDPTVVADIPIEITEVGCDRLDLIRRLNLAIFDDEHIINSFSRDDLLMLVAWTDGQAIGFKIGYQMDTSSFYSAKGGVRAAYRRNGVARALLYAMLDIADARGYDRFVYDTFPNKHPGMTVMGLDEGFEVIRAGYSSRYQDYRLRFELRLDDPGESAQ